MQKFRSIIVDDEELARQNLKSMITNYCPELDIIGEASSVLESQAMIIELKPDIVFLDILMPSNNGFDLIELFPNRNFVVVFVSASSDFGIQAVKANVLDYILKPVSINEIQFAAKKIISHFNFNSLKSDSPVAAYDKIALSYSGGFAIEELINIVRLHADDNYTNVFTLTGKKYLISKPLKDFERILPSTSFHRVHKSHIINIQHMRDYSNEDGGTVVLKDGTKIPVSKRKNSLFLQTIKNTSLILK
jgi:two-component system, LytTR family, response regulator